MEILDSLRYKTLFSTHQTRRGVKANVVLLARVAQAKSFCTVRTTAPRLLMWRHGGTSRFFFFLLLSLPCTCTSTCIPNTQLTCNQANCRVEWCVVIFDRHDYPAEPVRKRSLINLGEHTHQKASVQSELSAILSQTGWLACRLCFKPASMFNQTSVFVCLTVALICSPDKPQR